MKAIRCAIYTRKSSEERLEQEFNSLDAQREACEAYIKSQKSAGWVALADMYDDGGISGGTMERPALQRLLADIAAGRIDTVVVYKVDRLTRSLRDFAKIVDAFDANAVSFVSVTQLLKDPAAILELAGTTTVSARKALIARATELAQRWPELSASERRGILGVCLFRIEVRTETVEMAVRHSALIEVIRDDKMHGRTGMSNTGANIHLTIPARVRRTGLSNTLVIEGKSATTARPDRSLLRLIMMAQRFNALVMNNAEERVSHLAATAGVSRSYFSRVLRLSFLAPDITKAIILGRQPPEFNAIKLMRAGQFPLHWSDQCRAFGFD